jgi:NosR/NirI family nitrous oxide reductase transcriptional regulator
VNFKTHHLVGFRPWHLAALLVPCLAAVLAASTPANAETRLNHYLTQLQPRDIDPAADAFGPVGGPLPAAPLLKGGQVVGYAFLNQDIVDSTGYSGKPIDIVVGLGVDGHITGAKLVEHHEPIFLVGIPPAKVEHFIAGYVGQDMLKASVGGRTPADIVSGATVSSMVIADSITRASLKIAEAYHIGGAVAPVADAAAKRQIDPAKAGTESWTELLGDGSVRRLFLSNHDVNDAFQRSGDAAAIARPETGAPDAPFLDVYVALASVPTIGQSLLGDAQYKLLKDSLKPGQQAVLIAGDGPYSFRGSGYVRGGIFDRIELIQGQSSFRFHDRDYKRLGDIHADGAPEFPEIGLFAIPDGRTLEPGEPWRLQVLVQRRTGAIEKAFVTEAVSYSTPDKYLTAAAPPAPAAPAAANQPATAAAAAAAPQAPSPALASVNDAAPPIWVLIWQSKKVDIAILLVAILTLTGIFFFQDFLVKKPKLYERLRLSFLAFTLIWLGWYEHAQLSVVNVLTFINALRGSFQWDYFLKDPLIFILWGAVAAALIFWGRGAYCGWLCPFGALQEWTNRIARALHVPQVKVPFGLHQRLWPIKYIIFMALLGVSFGSVSLAEKLAEVEPFKTAIILHFVRDWWFVLIALAFLLPGLVIERFYCRYLCPLGGALAIPARIRMFNWLKRYDECGKPCQRCANECPVKAIHPSGEINPNECIQCLNCQVVYHDNQKCPVLVVKRRKREKQIAAMAASAGAAAASPTPNQPTAQREPTLAHADPGPTGLN